MKKSSPSAVLFRFAALALGLIPWLTFCAPAASFDAWPFGLPLPEPNGVMWEDPREIHRVVVHFQDATVAPDHLRVEYWGSWWPERHLPKDQEPGGGEIGWLELGNWHKYEWRRADTDAKADGKSVTFTFRPINQTEFPKVKEYSAPFRYTLKLRVTADEPLPAVARIETFTDSELEAKSVRLAWGTPPEAAPTVEAFNGAVKSVDRLGPQLFRVSLESTTNSDPNTFDRTLVTVRTREGVFTFKTDDLASGPLFLPHLGVAVLASSDERDYAAVAAEQQARGAKSLYDRVAELPEQTWSSAWEGVPRKKSDIYFPMGLDGGRQRFRVEANGTILFRSNDHFLQGLPGRETERLSLERGPVRLEFGFPNRPSQRTLQEESLPVCQSTWEIDGVTVQETTFVTELNGTQATGPTPPADATAVCLARLTFTNASDAPKTARLPLRFFAGDSAMRLRVDPDGCFWTDAGLRGQLSSDARPNATESQPLNWSWTLGPRQTCTVVLKVPYVVLRGEGERTALMSLSFDRERTAVAGYWRSQLDRSARLITPEPMLNEFYRSHPMHLLVNCEREPDSDRRFARVGSFSYGAYGNESCMMVVDLDRRGYHKEAQDCLDAWLKYQGTVELPGSFASKDGVLYGAAGYEAGGYNQHHGWILWMLAEHYRFTRDAAWLRQSASGLVKGADWIIRETKRTADRHPLERGLLPAGSLEDIGDWWTWLSTSCYTWRGLDAAGWALEQIDHPEAARIQKEAESYHRNLLANFRAAAERAPVVRLRDGTAVPHIPSHVHRRGRCFGWICETLEGAIHLIITKAIDPASQEATWILKDYEDNLYLSNQYGYTLDDFEKHWFGRGGMSMQACLLLDVEPYLYRNDVKHALRSLFNGQAVSYFPDVRMNTEHALPNMEDWRGDQFKSSDEANTAGWLRYLFVREDGNLLLMGQAVPRTWLREGKRCGIERTATHFGPASVVFTGGSDRITAEVAGPVRNPPQAIGLRFRHPESRAIASVTVNDKPWSRFKGEWVDLPGDVGVATVTVQY